MYTQTLVDDLKAELCQSLDYWKMSADTRIELLTTSENATFVSHDPLTNHKRIIRVHRPDYHDQQEIESELAWIHDLRASGRVNTPSPINTTTGSPVIKMAINGRDFHAVAFEHVSGSEPNVGEALPDWFEKLGAVTASLHEHSRTWQRPDWFARKRWNLDTMIAPDGLWGDWHQAPGITSKDEDIIHQAIEHIHLVIDAYGHHEDRYGLVHADLRLANLLVNDDQLAVIDFDDSGFCWYAYDFAAAISFHELDPMIPKLRDAWIRGYQTIAQFDDEDIAALDTFIMIRRIMLSAWLATHAETPTAQALAPGYIQGTAELARQYLYARG